MVGNIINIVKFGENCYRNTSRADTSMSLSGAHRWQTSATLVTKKIATVCTQFKTLPLEVLQTTALVMKVMKEQANLLPTGSNLVVINQQDEVIRQNPIQYIVRNLYNYEIRLVELNDVIGQAEKVITSNTPKKGLEELNKLRIPV